MTFFKEYENQSFDNSVSRFFDFHFLKKKKTCVRASQLQAKTVSQNYYDFAKIVAIAKTETYRKNCPTRRVKGEHYILHLQIRHMSFLLRFLEAILYLFHART